MTITRGDIIDWTRGECDAATSDGVVALLKSSGKAGDAARSELRLVRGVMGLVRDLPELDANDSLDRRVVTSITNDRTQNTKDLDATDAAFLSALNSRIPTMRVSNTLIRRIDASLYKASIAEDSPMVATMVRLLSEGGPESQARVAAMVAKLPLLQAQRNEIASVLQSVARLAPPDAARSARRISERLRAVLAAEPASSAPDTASIKLPELAVSSSLDSRIQASLAAETKLEQAELATDDDENADAPRPGHLYSLSTWRSFRALPSLSRARGLAVASLMHGTVLAALLFVVSTPKGQPMPVTAAITTMTEVRATEAVPIDSDRDTTPIAARMVRVVPMPATGPLSAELPEQALTKPWELDSMLLPELGESLSRTVDAPRRGPIDYGMRRSGISRRGSMVPADIGEGELLFSWRRDANTLKATVYPDDMAWLLRLEEILGYLRRAQRADGSFGGGINQDIPTTESLGAWDLAARKVENTALAILALTGDGHGGMADTPEKTVTRAAAWLASQQNSSGGFVSIERDGVMVAQNTILTDAICTLALAEAWALSDETTLRDAMRRGLRRLLAAQIGSPSGPVPSTESDRGGWAAGTGGESDAVTVNYVIQALLTAKALKWREPNLDAVLAAAKSWVKTQSTGDFSSREGFTGIAARPTGDPAVRQTGERSVASATAALMATARLLEVANESVEASQRAFLGRPQYLPSLEAFGPIGARYYPTNLTGWAMTSMAFHDGDLDEAELVWVKHFGAKVFAPGSLYETSGKDLGSLVPRGEEEQLRGRVFIAAMCALAIENAWRWRVSRGRE